MTTYFIKVNPFHNKYIPPKVNITDTNGSTIKNILNFKFSCVVLRIKPNKKKINAIDRIWPCTMDNISLSLFLNFITKASSSFSFPKYCSSIPLGLADEVSFTNNNPEKKPTLNTMMKAESNNFISLGKVWIKPFHCII